MQLDRARRMRRAPLGCTPRRNAARLPKPKAAYRKETNSFDYRAIRYVRSPSTLFVDSIFSPPLLLRILTKPRIVWLAFLACFVAAGATLSLICSFLILNRPFLRSLRMTIHRSGAV
jgi:hypothetical protein